MKVSYPFTGWLRLTDKQKIPVPKVLLEIPGIKQLDECAVELPYTTWDVPEVVSWLDDHGVELDDAAVASEAADTTVRPLGYAGLYKHQREAVEWLLQHPGGLLCDSMGLGKTASAIVAADSYAGTSEQPRIIVGPKLVRNAWKRELLRVGSITREDQFEALEGRDSTRAFNRDAKWYFLHYEIVNAWWSRLSLRRPIVGIADEAHAIKDPKSKRAKGAALVLGVCPFRIVLTGTPILNRTSELWSLIDLAAGSRTFGTNFDFKMRYCGFVHNGHGYEEQEPTHTEELAARLKSVYLRRTVEDAGLNIPSLTRTVEDISLDRRALEECDDLLSNSRTSYEEIFAALQAGGISEVLPVIMELRKVTAHAKLSHTTEYVVSLVEQGESAVVFTWERATAELLAGRVGHQTGGSTYVIHGGFSQPDRDRMVDAFQQKGGVIFATIDALGVGVTLTRARTVILHDLDWTPAKLLQAEGRVRRIGQTHPCQSVWMVAGRSIDVLFARMLFAKGATISKTLYDDSALQAAEGIAHLSDASLEADIERLIKF